MSKWRTVRSHLYVVLFAVFVAASPLLTLTVLSKVNSGLEPLMFWTIPIGLFAGYVLLWRRYPRYAYPIGVVFIPVVGAALVFVWISLHGFYI
jgi:hypothetical protein